MMLRSWVSRTYGYITYDWFISLIVAVGVALVLLIAFGGGNSIAVMGSTLLIGVLMGIMVAARQKHLTEAAKHTQRRRRRR